MPIFLVCAYASMISAAIQDHPIAIGVLLDDRSAGRSGMACMKTIAFSTLAAVTMALSLVASAGAARPMAGARAAWRRAGRI